MDHGVPISEARATLGDLVVEAAEHEVFLLEHGRPVAVLLSIEAYESVVERLEDLEDTVATLRAREENDFVPFVPQADGQDPVADDPAGR
jgi:prevent-host-death family protein